MKNCFNDWSQSTLMCMYLLFLVSSVIAHGFTIKIENCVDPDLFLCQKIQLPFKINNSQNQGLIIKKYMVIK